MAIPLYGDIDSNRPEEYTAENGHEGLRFTRFYDRYKSGFTDLKENDNSFSDWLETFQKKVGDAELLDSAIVRQSRLVKALGGVSLVVKCDWRFVHGLGLPHPVENGFTWHPVWGVPYIPGSSLKGMVRSWIEAWWEGTAESDDNKEKLSRLKDWFGSVDKIPDPDNPFETGSIIFFDAIPRDPVSLAVEIMTPHMGNWYSEGESIESIHLEPEKVPADWHSPNPIYFLAADCPEFLVSLAPRNENSANQIDFKEVEQCLQDALDWLGAGGKTAVGFGHFELQKLQTETLNDRISREIEDDAQGAFGDALDKNMPEPCKDLLVLSHSENWKADKNKFTKPGVLEHHLKEISDCSNKEVIELLDMLFEKHYPGLLENPDKKVGKKLNKDAFKPKQKELAIGYLDIRKKYLGYQ